MKRSSSSWTAPSRLSYFRDTRQGRTLLLLALVALSNWIGEAVFAARDAIVGAGGAAASHGPEPFRNSFNVDGLAILGGQVASSISREWWEILTALLIIGMSVAAVRFLDGVRPRAALAELGLRGDLPRAWRWLLLVPLLPPLVWLGYTMLTTEPRVLGEPWTWRQYFFPFADREGSVLGLMLKEYSARPVWWLNSGVGHLASALFMYGLVWRQLRRLRFGFTASIGLIALAELFVVVVSNVRFPGSSMFNDFPVGMILELTGFFFGVVLLALGAWIVDRWGGRVWVPALVVFGTGLPYLLAYPFYEIGDFQVSDGDEWLIWVYSTIYALGPPILLAVLTAMAPRFGLPSLIRWNEGCERQSPP